MAETQQNHHQHHQIMVKLLDGKHKTINLTTPSISIPSLKTLIHNLTFIPSYHQLLLLNSRLLHDNQTLFLTDQPDQAPCSNHSENGPHLKPNQVPYPHTKSNKVVCLDDLEIGSHTNPNEVLCPNDFENGSHKKRNFPLIIHVLGRLRGGKGGFGSLLRGAATKAGQKKTNNFDACRDMSGRRLRHVNAEKKLEDWRAEEDARRLEKVAEDWIKKKTKEAKKKGIGGGSGDAERYVEKYREDSEKCREDVERSVREVIRGSGDLKRKGGGDASGSDSKKLKIWLGKRELNDSDNDDMDEDDSDDDAKDEENEKSVVIDSGNHSVSNKELEGSSGSVTGGKLGGESSAGHSSDSGSSEEDETIGKSSLKSGQGAAHNEENGVRKPPALEVHEEKMVEDRGLSCLEATVVSGTKAVEGEKQESNETKSIHVEDTVIQPPSNANSGEEAEIKCNSNTEPVVQEETFSASRNVPDVEKPLDFDEFSSAADMEVFGMERLKSELQARGLKCGGTLQERAGRLFLLKTTPLEMIPKKLFAKK